MFTVISYLATLCDNVLKNPKNGALRQLWRQLRIC